MDFKTYKTLVAKIETGKVLPDARYVHESALSCVPSELLAFVERQRSELAIPNVNYNVLKFHHRDFKVSLLQYPTFFDDPYPALKESCTIDFERRKHRVTDFSDSDNPPILHRKETFLLPTDPRVPALREMTAEAEQAGLYDKANSIGFKLSWERLISRKGYLVVDGRLAPKSTIRYQSEPVTTHVTVERHLTAIDRNKLSQPLQILARHDYLNGNFTILDYGCGKGDDVRELEAHGIDVAAWDPVYRPDSRLRQADIVNLGYVINVIEDRQERAETLCKAYNYAHRVLVVSAMLAGESLISQFRPYKDGVLTSRNTFQRYYTQSELRDYIESTLGDNTVALAPGIFAIFQDKVEEQRFLSERQHIRRNWRQLTAREPKIPETRVARELIEKHRKLFDDFWDTILDLGRIPTNDEYEFSERVRAVAGSHNKAFEALQEHYGRDIFQQALEARRGDLLVYFALGQFAKRNPYSHMPEGLKRDIKAFFGSYRDAIGEARELLFSIANTELIESACAQVYAKLQCGQLNEGHSLVIHRTHLSALSPLLRVYVGCAAQLYGDIDDVDLIKIHMKSGKVTLMKYDDFARKPIPELIERVKVKLREQDIDVFQYAGVYSPQPLYFKSQYIPSDFPRYEEQRAFDDELNHRNLVDLSGFGAQKDELNEALRKAGLAIKDFKLERAK